MSERNSQTIILSRQSILMVTAVGVSLLTLCYVLGVQVGKQSAALHQPTAKGSGEELQELPAPLLEQLKDLEGLELEKAQRVVPGNQVSRVENPSARSDSPDRKKETPAKPGSQKKQESPKKPELPKGERWTAQLMSTTDSSEADRVAAKAKAAGFTVIIVKGKSSIKVRLAKSASRADVDTAITKLKVKGLDAFAVKVD